jgi:hypothetical protein
MVTSWVFRSPYSSQYLNGIAVSIDLGVIIATNYGTSTLTILSLLTGAQVCTLSMAALA